MLLKILGLINRCLAPLGIIPIVVVSIFLIFAGIEFHYRQLMEYFSFSTILIQIQMQTILTVLLLSYWKCSFADPGYVKEDFFQLTKSGFEDVEFDKYKINIWELVRQKECDVQTYFEKYQDSLNNQGVTQCNRCNLIRPERAHHCSFCNKCIMRQDHHCPWINNCVGHENYKFFIQFLTSSQILGWSYIQLEREYYYFRFQLKGISYNSDTLRIILKQNWMYSFYIHDLIFGLILGIFVLLLTQIVLLCMNRTQYDIAFPHLGLSKYNKGLNNNLKDVLGNSLDLNVLHPLRPAISKIDGYVKGYQVNAFEENDTDLNFNMKYDEVEMESKGLLENY